MQKDKFKNLLNDMSAHSIRDYPREACGIITNNFEYIACTNISATPKRSFIIDPIAILQHENNIWGFYHSHPGSADPVPSKKDLESTLFTEFKFVVGFADNFYIYWLNENHELSFERFNENHYSI